MKVKARDYGVCFCTLNSCSIHVGRWQCRRNYASRNEQFSGSKADGTLIVRSMGHGNVLRIAAGNELKASTPLRFARDGYWEPRLQKVIVPAFLLWYKSGGTHRNGSTRYVRRP
jgi:hypothetical protein